MATSENGVKNGLLTTEFWLVLVGSAVAVVVAAGVLTPEEGEAITSATVEVIKAISVLVGVLAPIIGSAVYTIGRSKVKAANGNK